MKRIVRRELEDEARRAIKANRKPCSIRTVNLGDQSVILIHSGNFLALSDWEREFVVGIIDLVERFEVAQKLFAVQSPGDLQESTRGAQGVQDVGLASTVNSDSPDSKEEEKGGN